MPDDLPPLPTHGVAQLPGLRIDVYGTDLPAADGQFGDRASARAFDAILLEWRQRLRRNGGRDPFGEVPPEEVGRDVLDAALTGGAPEVAGLVHGAIEDFARNLASVIRRFLALPGWQGTQRMLVGGGFRSGRIGDIALGRAGVLLRAEGIAVSVAPIRHGAEEAGLIGATRLVPERFLAGADAVLAVDLGGASFRAGLVLPRLGVAPDLAAAGVWKSRSWRAGQPHPDGVTALRHLAVLMSDLAAEAAAVGLALPPVTPLVLPGVVQSDGRISDAAATLPGEWQEEEFHLPSALSQAVTFADGTQPTVLLHNDAVAQGLSEASFQRDVARWGVLTIGPALGSARFTNLPMRR